MSTQGPAVPPEYAAFVDDAAIFPPGNAPLSDAVAAYRGHSQAPYAALLGPFVVTDVRLPELVEVLTADPALASAGEPLPVTVVCTGGAGSLEPAARWATGSPVLALRGLEVALRDAFDPVGAARRVAAAAGRAVTGPDVAVHVEPPRPLGGPTARWLAALDEIAAADLRLKLRTGGVSADLFPPAAELAGCIEAALDRELPFKCTAGLHHAVRHRDPATGFEHHGFLNVLLATRAGLDGEDVGGVLETADAEAVVDRVRAVGGDALSRARRWFTSFGCCGVHDPLEDLVDLGLVRF